MSSPRAFAAVDLGADSGRVALGRLDGRRVALHVVHRFANGPVRTLDTMHWDVLRLYSEVLEALRRSAASSPAWTSGFGADCAVTASNNANAASPSPGYSGNWACRRHRQAEWAVPAKGHGESPIAPRSTRPCRSNGSTLRASFHLSPNMTRYTIK